jgi:dihydrofolate reductase
MRKIIVSNYITIDGFFAGPNGELDWFVWDDEMAKFSIDQLKTVGTILLGRVTYQFFADYWPTSAAFKENPIIAPMMNDLPKIVFTKTLDRTEWNNSKIVKGNVAEEISKLKQQPGKDMVIFGSGTIVSSFAKLGLIDLYRLIVNPVILGSGKPLFKGLDDKLKMKLLNAKALGSGNVILEYQPMKDKPL